MKEFKEMQHERLRFIFQIKNILSPIVRLTLLVPRLGLLVRVGRVLERLDGSRGTLGVLQLLRGAEREVRRADNLANVRRVGSQRGPDALSNGGGGEGRRLAVQECVRIGIVVVRRAVQVAGAGQLGSLVRIAISQGLWGVYKFN